MMHRHAWMISLVCLLLLFASCLKDLKPNGAPCRDDSDCWGGVTCLNKVCGGATSTDAGTESTIEANMPDEPVGKDAPLTKEEPLVAPEPRPEPVKETPPEPPGPAIGKKLYEPCSWFDWAAPDERCRQGLHCYRVSVDKAFCLADCSADPNVCQSQTDGRSTCRIIDWNKEDRPIRVCVQEADLNGACDQSRGLFCKRTNATPASCQKFTCKAIKSAKANENCNPHVDPPVLCDIRDEQICGQQNVCVKGRRIFEWDHCDDKLCGRGTSCKKTTYAGSFCIRSCQSDQDCVNSPVPSLCFQGGCHALGCVGDYDCPYRDHPMECATSSQTNRSLCTPRLYPGVLNYGEVCKDGPLSDSSIRCRDNLRCLKFGQGVTYGLCTPHCQVDADCQKYDAKAGCIIPAGKRKLCGRRCISPADCPPKHVCTQNFCAPEKP